MKNSNGLKIAAFALSVLGAIIGLGVDAINDKQMEEEVKKEVAKQLKDKES